MEQTVKQRLTDFLKIKGISQKKFAEIVGLSSGYVNAIRTSIQPDTLHKIAIQFPELNTGWLITGDGEMFKSPIVQSVSGTANIVGQNHIINSPIDNRQYFSDSPDVLRAQIELLDERIKEKDAQIKEKDAQIKQLLDILQKK